MKKDFMKKITPKEMFLMHKVFGCVYQYLYNRYNTEKCDNAHITSMFKDFISLLQEDEEFAEELENVEKYGKRHFSHTETKH